MEAQNFSTKYLNANSIIINDFFEQIKGIKDVDFKELYLTKPESISKLEMCILKVAEGLFKIFDNSIIADSNATLDFTQDYEFNFVLDSIPTKSVSENFLKNISLYYQMWLTSKNIKSIESLTIKNCINEILVSKSEDFIYIFYLILFQSCLLHVDNYFNFKRKKGIRKIFKKVISFKENISNKLKIELEAKKELFIKKISKLFFKSIYIDTITE